MANAAAIGTHLRRSVIGTHAANALSASRFVLAAVWLAAFVCDDRRPGVLGPIALAAVLSDFADGPVARQMRSADRFGRWLDSLADIAFVLTALICEAQATAIPDLHPRPGRGFVCSVRNRLDNDQRLFRSRREAGSDIGEAF